MLFIIATVFHGRAVQCTAERSILCTKTTYYKVQLHILSQSLFFFNCYIVRCCLKTPIIVKPKWQRPCWGE